MADKIIYTLELDDRGFAAVVRNANGEVVQLDKLIKKTGDDGGKSFQGLTATVRDLSLAYSGVKDAISTVANTFKSFIAESENARKSSSQLDLALKNINAESMGQGIKDLADSLENAGIQEADAAIKAAALGVQMGISSDKIKDATTGAIGLSKSYNIDLDGAMKLVAGGMQGNYDMLARLNPAMRAAGTEAEKAAIFQKMLADGFKFAESEGKTFSGEMERLQNKIGNVKEAIGGFLIKVILPLAKALSENMPLAIGVVSGALVGMIVPVYTLVTAVSALGTAVTAATGGLNLLIAAGAALTVGGIAYVATMDDSTEATTKNTEATKENVKIKNQLTAAEQSFVDEVKKIQESLLTENEKAIKSEEDKLKKIQELRATYAETFRNSGQNLAELEELARLEIEQTKKLNEVKNKENTEAAAKKLEEQKKLDDEIFAENMAAYNKELAEQKKRIADFAISLNEKNALRLQSEEDAMQSEMDGYLEQYENQKAHDEEMKALTEEMAQSELSGLDAILNQNLTAYNADFENHKALLEQKKITQEQYDEYMTKRTSKIMADNQKAALQSGKQALKQMESDLKQASALGKDFNKVAKVAAIANTTIASIEASMQAYKAMAGIPVVGPALGVAASVAALLAGAGAVAKITSTSQGYKTGGYTGSGSVDEVAGVVHKEEFVNTAETVDRVGIPALEALQDGKATIVPITSVARPESFSGSVNTDYIANSVQALSMNLVSSDNSNSKETVIINNSDLVTITKKIEQVKSENKNMTTNKTTRSYR